jgi:geranylgeranyl pyrophosphate synthase
VIQIQDFLSRARPLVEAELERALAPEGPLAAAMRHAVLGGGKRLRPLVVIAAAEACGGTLEAALPSACAIELVHAYSLVHDDLPAMDDDRERRGKPTVWVAFGEANAILAGNALLTLAFRMLLDREAVRVLGSASSELLDGQARDLAGPPADFAALELIHVGKTGALFTAAALLGALAGGATETQTMALFDYGRFLGLAFQHADDLADGEHAAFAAQARTRLAELRAATKRALAPFGERGALLDALADHVLPR